MLSNQLRSSANVVSSNDETALTIKDPMSVVSATDAVKGGLATRTWKGLELNIDNVPVAKAVSGHTGTPSTGYTCPESDTVK